jgi:hypothetical protein
MRALIAAGAAALGLACATGCGSGSSTQSASSPQEQVKRNWIAFFDGSTPASRKVALLQNGQQFAPLIQAEANSPLARQTAVTVSKVTLLSATRANVVYTITLAGQPALKNQVGTAVLVGKTWEVSDQSFCALLGLEGATPPACRHL